MGSIYQAALWCDDCTEAIKHRVAMELWARKEYALCPAGTKVSDYKTFEDFADHLLYMGEYDYDSDAFPKRCDVTGASDCPNHCDGCGEFLENDLTADGADYVVAAVREALESGDTDCVAITEWMPHYFWLDYPNIGKCSICGEFGELDTCDWCEDEVACSDRIIEDAERFICNGHTD